MAKEDKRETKRVQKGNSSDTLLAIYILRVLKQYSSAANALTVQDVIKHLQEDHSIGYVENEESQKKKIRRYLDTLCESYGKGCIVKTEGARKDGYKWYYDPSKDAFAGEERHKYETLSNEEIDFLIDIIASSKIINTKSTYGLIKKLLKKADLSKEERKRRVREIEKEVWPKSINKEFVELRDKLDLCILDYRKIQFDYNGQESISATPYGWDSDADGKYVLIAQVDGENDFKPFVLEEIRNLKEGAMNYDQSKEDEYYGRHYQKPNNDASLESLFVNIHKINTSIEQRASVEFKYLSYIISDGKVVSKGKNKKVLPQSLVFTDGKYYLIGLDEEKGLIDYYRVDLISSLCSLERIKPSDWNRALDGIQRAREIEKHPLMMAGRDIPVTFKVIESKLDSVMDAFGKKANDLKVTTETRITPSQNMLTDNTSYEHREERIVRVDVRTTADEAFMWALANAEFVELVSPQAIRDRLARIADPIYQLYTQSLSDKVRKNIDLVIKEGAFNISRDVDEATAYKTYQELSKRGKLDAVKGIKISGIDAFDNGDYLSEFINTTRLSVASSECKSFSWAKQLVNMEIIDMMMMQIDDTSWMKEMKKLKRLHLSESSVSDLSVLSEHKHIDYIDIGGTEVSDISFIENYENLTSLNIVRCPIEDYSPLLTTKSRLKSLEIDEDSLQAIGEENVRAHHIGINIKVYKNNPFWWLDI